jgi:RecA-family ATPase
MNLLPVEPAWRLADRAEDQRWLVTGLWSDQAVGIIGGEPKCCKSFLALDLAVAVAAGVPCLRRFAVPRAGRVLLYAAEDALHIVRRRLDGICAAAGLALADLDVQVITAPTVRLDLEADRRSLDATVAQWRPRLLVLDPFVRLHRIDENASGEVAPLLAYLRELQRRHAIAVSSSTTPRRAPATSAPVRPCEAPPSSMPGAIPTSTSAATTIPAKMAILP